MQKISLHRLADDISLNIFVSEFPGFQKLLLSFLKGKLGEGALNKFPPSF